MISLTRQPHANSVYKIRLYRYRDNREGRTRGERPTFQPSHIQLETGRKQFRALHSGVGDQTRENDRSNNPRIDRIEFLPDIFNAITQSPYLPILTTGLAWWFFTRLAFGKRSVGGTFCR